MCLLVLDTHSALLFDTEKRSKSILAKYSSERRCLGSRIIPPSISQFKNGHFVNQKQIVFLMFYESSKMGGSQNYTKRTKITREFEMVTVRVFVLTSYKREHTVFTSYRRRRKKTG